MISTLAARAVSANAWQCCSRSRASTAPGRRRICAGSGRSPSWSRIGRKRPCTVPDFAATAWRAIRRRTAGDRTPSRRPPSRLFRGVEHALGHSSSPKPRARRIGRAIAKGRRQQIMEAAALGRHRRLGVLDQVLEQSCSSTESTSFSVEIWCCASTRRQQMPASARASDDSAAGVQVRDGIDEAGNSLDQRKRLAVEHGVVVLEPEAATASSPPTMASSER